MTDSLETLNSAKTYFKKLLYTQALTILRVSAYRLEK